jgi:hypothetical protein
MLWFEKLCEGSKGSMYKYNKVHSNKYIHMHSVFNDQDMYISSLHMYVGSAILTKNLFKSRQNSFFVWNIAQFIQMFTWAIIHLRNSIFFKKNVFHNISWSCTFFHSRISFWTKCKNEMSFGKNFCLVFD